MPTIKQKLAIIAKIEKRAGHKIRWSKPCWVYMVHEMDSDWYKIGITANDPIKRLNNLQCGNPHRLVLFAAAFVKEPKFMEALIHYDTLENRKKFREWFFLSSYDARLVAEFMDQLSKL